MKGLSANNVAALANISQNLSVLDKRIEAACVAVCQRYAQEGAGWAKQNKTWRDHSSNAVKGLHGYVPPKSETNRLTARISHGVEYGIYLEKRWNGKYGILLKTLRRFQAPFLEDIKRAVKGGPF